MKITGTRNALDLRSRDLEPVALSLARDVVYRTYELRSLFFAMADRCRLIGSQKARRRGSAHARHTNSRDVLEIVFSEAAGSPRPRR